MRKNPKNMTAPEMVAKIILHRSIWQALRAVNNNRIAIHSDIQRTANLPPPQKLPYVQANKDRVMVVAAAKEMDAKFVTAVEESIRAALD